MASFGSVIFKRLNTASNIRAAVNGNILPEFRDDLVPAIVYDIQLTDTENTLSRDVVRGLQHYEVSLSVIDATYKGAAETADLVTRNIENANWTDSPYIVQAFECKERDEDYIDLAGKNKRLAVIDLRFDFTIKTS